MLLVKAGDFTVLNNADSGPGSLRDAILQANASPATAPNRILFNIPDVSTAGRTITLLTTLPLLSSKLTVDATTQPGPAFGPTGARIILTNFYSWQYGYYFDMLSVSDIQVYGFWMQGVGGGAGFHFKSSHKLQLGMPGKGNIISGFTFAVYCDNNISEPNSSDVIIQNNFFGTDENGLLARFNNTGLYVENVANLQIGGPLPGEGNQMVESGYPAEIKYTKTDDFGFLTIEGNMQGTDYTGNKRLSLGHGSWQIDGYNDGDGSKVTGLTPVVIRIINNVGVGGFSFYSIASPFTIQGNHLGVGLDNTSNLIAGTNYGMTSLLFFSYCSGGIIGGAGISQPNWLAYDIYGIFEFSCSNITISRNSIFCNTGPGIIMDWQVRGRPMPFASINLLTAGLVGGKSLPNALIELFYDDECLGCEGKTYIGSTNADNNGNWSYPIAATGAIVATATDSYGTTSFFSTATINTTKIAVKNASCGRNNGSIKNIEVSSGTQWYWKNAAGNIVANSVDLDSVGPGTYTFVTSIGGADCEAVSAPYTIKNIALPAFDPALIATTQPSCGQDNGALKFAGSFDPSSVYTWKRAGNVVVNDFSLTNPLNNLPPGDYTLHLALRLDSTCSAQYGPIALINQNGPTLSSNAVAITATTCGKKNGSITGMSYQNAVTPLVIAWKDSLGKTVGNMMDLLGVAAGKYRLLFRDAGGCDTIFSSWFTIPDQGSIRFDTSKMQVIPASCAAANGSITGILFTGVSIFSWKDISTGASVGNAADLTQVSAGHYLLTMSNTFGCQAQTNPVIISQLPIPAFNYANLKTVNDTCNTRQAAVLGLTAMDNPLKLTWSWFAVDANGLPTGTSIGAGQGLLTGLSAGSYKAVLTDVAGCSTSSKVFTLGNIAISPALPSVTDQFIPRNTSTVIRVKNLQNGSYQLLDNNSPNAVILDKNTTGALLTPIMTADKIFYVVLTRGDCSSPTVPVSVKVFDSTRIFVPNSFSPNADGINDQWRITVRGLTKRIHIMVYDRWGLPVFSSVDAAIPWDGRFRGQFIPGNYVYLIDGIDYYDRPFKLRGTILLMQ